MDHVFVRALCVEAIIGIYDFERVNPQRVIVNLDMAFDNRPAAKSRDIDDALNYKAVADSVRALIIDGEYLLVESLAEDIADLVMNNFLVPWVSVEVMKPDAISDIEAVGVRIERGEAS